jgi:hypothetical protein
VRALFFALLLANLAFFGWADWIDVPQATGTAPLQDRGVPMLALAQPLSHPLPGQRCRTLGPFVDEIAARTAAATLRTRGIAPRDRTVDSSVEDGYWVYIGDLNDPAAQRSALARLQRGGIHDAAVMTDAGEAGRLSVGIFNEQARAVRRAEEVRALGFTPILDLHQRVQRAYWLDMDLHADQPEPPVTALKSPSVSGDVKLADSGVAFSDCPDSDRHG